jgi:hypothetical protein
VTSKTVKDATSIEDVQLNIKLIGVWTFISKEVDIQEQNKHIQY